MIYKKLLMSAFVILLTIVLLSLFIWLVSLFLKPGIIDDTWVSSYCQVSEKKAKNGPNVYVTYWIKDDSNNRLVSKEMYAASLRSRTAVIGEVFPISYNPKNPEEFFVATWKPIFLEGEVSMTAIGKIIREPSSLGISDKESKEYSTHYIEFTFTMNGTTYRKFQHLPPMYIQKDSGTIVKGRKFEVEYWVENPQRAIIYLDKPIP